MATKPLKTARDMFYFVEDVMRILGYSKSKSYKVIKLSLIHILTLPTNSLV